MDWALVNGTSKTYNNRAEKGTFPPIRALWKNAPPPFHPVPLYLASFGGTELPPPPMYYRLSPMDDILWLRIIWVLMQAFHGESRVINHQGGDDFEEANFVVIRTLSISWHTQRVIHLWPFWINLLSCHFPGIWYVLDTHESFIVTPHCTVYDVVVTILGRIILTQSSEYLYFLWIAKHNSIDIQMVDRRLLIERVSMSNFESFTMPLFSSRFVEHYCLGKKNTLQRQLHIRFYFGFKSSWYNKIANYISGVRHCHFNFLDCCQLYSMAKSWILPITKKQLKKLCKRAQ